MISFKINKSIISILLIIGLLSCYGCCSNNYITKDPKKGPESAIFKYLKSIEEENVNERDDSMYSEEMQKARWEHFLEDDLIVAEEQMEEDRKTLKNDYNYDVNETRFTAKCIGHYTDEKLKRQNKSISIIYEDLKLNITDGVWYEVQSEGSKIIFMELQKINGSWYMIGFHNKCDYEAIKK